VCGLRTTLGPLHDVVLGGTVIGLGTGAPPAYRTCVVTHLADVAGMSLRPHLTAPSALQHGDDLAAVSSSLAQLSQVLLKLGADLRLLASGPRGGFGELELPAVIAGSSFFTGKQNPVVAETLIQACLQTQGYAHTAHLAAGRAELYLQIHDGLVALNILDGLALLTAAVDRTDRYAIRGLRADEDRCRWLAGLARSGGSEPHTP
jgi:aspartate ammonia-lyase